LHRIRLCYSAAQQPQSACPVASKEPKIGNIGEVASAIRLAASQDKSALGRTVFLIGAGCSKSAGIPLVPDMARDLVVKLAAALHGSGSAPSDPEGAYRWLLQGGKISDCQIGERPKDGTGDSRAIDWSRVYDTLFAEHYNTPDDAREIFSQFVEGADGRVNWAHLCLGELAKQRLVSTIITTNFDQLVLAGLVRSGVLPVVCDGIESLTRIRGAPRHPQLIELHGSRHTYRLRNAPEELAALLNDAQAITAVESLFQELRVFVVVGYGGRETGVMDLLINAARHFTDKRLFWVLHGSDPAALNDKARDLLATSRNSALLIGQDADSFFLNLLRELNVGVPETVREPLFLARLHGTQLAQHDAAQIADAATIGAAIDRHRSEIAAMSKALDDHRNKQTATESALAKARELRLAGNRDDALKILQAAAKQSKSIAVWQEAAEVADEICGISAERTPRESAVAAWRQVIKRMEEEERDFDRLALAAVQNSLGNALTALGRRENGTVRLEEAVAAYRDALKERIRERVPLDWAATQNNLGVALHALGEREGGTARLEEAVAAYRDALKEQTRERVPLDWATTQNNLGIALRTLGERGGGTPPLEQAVAAFRDALKERTRERVPLDWAATQSNLGSALRILGDLQSGSARLEEAVAAFRDALKERARERAPLDWAMTQASLGIALLSLGQRENDPARLEEAISALRDALREYTRERSPLQWAVTLSNLGATLRALGERDGGTARLEEAIAAYRMALEELTPQSSPFYFSWAQRNLAIAEGLLAKRRK
jgi:tetratricopeptide (TPR) repeat protein